MPPPSGSLRRIALLRAAAAAVLLAGACIAQGPPGPPPPSERPAPRGTIRLAYPAVPPSLDPIEEMAPATADILRAVLPSFFLVTPSLEYRPSLLAERPRVEAAGDRMTVAFRIRADARWSDGTPITVEDVAFTAEAMRRAPGPGAAGFDHLLRVDEVSPREGRLVLSPPLADWRGLFSDGRFVLPDPGGGGATWDEGPPVSGGPFRLGRVVPGRSLTLERNPAFFGPSPLVERIEVVFVPDPTTAIQLLDAGLVDVVAPMLGFSWGRRLGGVPDAESSGGLGGVVDLVLNTASLPDGAARRDLAEAIDRARFADVALGGEGRLAQSVVPSRTRGSVPAWSRYGDDGDGVDLGGEVSLVYPRTELMELTARFVQAELRRGGADVELVPLEADVFWGTFVPARRFDLALIETRAAPFPDLDPWVGPPGQSLTGLDDPAMEEAVVEAASDESAVGAAQRALAGTAAVLPLYEPSTAMGWLDAVTGVQPNPSADGPLWNCWGWAKRV